MFINSMKCIMLTAILIGSSAGPSFAKDDASKVVKKGTLQTTAKGCLSLDEAAIFLKTYGEKNTYERLVRDAGATRDQNCAAEIKKAGDLMSALLLATIRQDADAICEASSTDKQKEIVLKLYRVSYNNDRSVGPCKTFTN